MAFRIKFQKLFFLLQISLSVWAEDTEVECPVCLPNYAGRNSTIQNYANNEASAIASDLNVQQSSLQKCPNGTSGLSGGTGGSGGSGGSGSSSSGESEPMKACGDKEEYECYIKEFYYSSRNGTESWTSKGCIEKSKKENFQKYPGLSINFSEGTASGGSSSGGSSSGTSGSSGNETDHNSSNINRIGWPGLMIVSSHVIGIRRFV